MLPITARPSTVRRQPITFGSSSNAQRNAEALKAMSQTERETGLTLEALVEQQRRLKAEAAERRARRTA